MSRLREESGRTIRLAIEPEPFCVIETTDETIDFFQRLRSWLPTATCSTGSTTFIGVCYDVCHQAVEFEDVADSLRRLQAVK